MFIYLLIYLNKFIASCFDKLTRLGLMGVAVHPLTDKMIHLS